VADFADKGHRPHGIHTGEEPENPISYGPEAIRVTLDTWGPENNLFPALFDALQSNWGDEPSRTVQMGVINSVAEDPDFHMLHRTGWNCLTDEQRAYVESCFAGKTLQQVLERITFSFTIDGVSRACTHQLVRTRLGAAFMQHGGRDNDWRHRGWTMPETIRRACNGPDVPGGCITNWEALDDYMMNQDYSPDVSLHRAIEDYLRHGRQLYAALVDAGIPWQDARRLLWIGTQTYIHADYNYLALKGVIGKRGEPVMDWEINCVAQLMLREVKMKCPPLLSKYLMPMSEAAGRDVFAGLESWTPTGRFKSVHPDLAGLKRLHRPEQNPFWILSEASMAGGPIEWIPTDGTWPGEAR